MTHQQTASTGTVHALPPTPRRALRRHVGAVLAASSALFGACAATSPEIVVEVYPPSSEEAPIELQAISWRELVFDWQSFAVLNESTFNLQLKKVELTAGVTEDLPTPDDGVLGWEDRIPGNTYLQLGDLDTPDIIIPIREREVLQTRFEPPKAGERTLWSSGAFKAELRFEVHAGEILDPYTGEVVTDPDKLPEPVEKVLYLSFDMDCDLDGDGHDAYACAGPDCNDDYASVSPDEVELCDGVDNNCRDSIDEGCADP
jgi:hypothetical protein